MTAPSEAGAMSGHRRAGARALAGLLLWLYAGYAALLWAGGAGKGSWWQALSCLGAAPFLLWVVLKVLGAPKRLLRRLPRPAARAVRAVTAALQFALPWLGWWALLALLNPGLPSPAAARLGGYIALFSYLTGIALAFAARPRPRDVTVTRVEAPLPHLPAAFDGYRILHISDLHAGWWHPERELAAKMALARREQCDLAVFTGDLADKHAGRVARAAEAVGSLEARDGVAAVLGNHDTWVGAELVTEALRARGVTVLVNEHLALRRGGDEIFLVGVGDASYSDADDLPAALEGVPEGACVILLSHTPDILREPEAGRAALVLSGHTHGGQIVLPLIGPFFVTARVGRRLASGLHRVGEQWLFVTRGLGEVFPPLRLACPPEIAVITLRLAP